MYYFFVDDIDNDYIAGYKFLDKWKNGKMEKWKNGKTEKWKNRKMDERT